MDITNIPFLQNNQTNIIQVEIQSSALHFRPFQDLKIVRYGSLTKDKAMQLVTMKMGESLEHIIKKLSKNPNDLN